jgi:pimeloyl-ACP methyl ester carboxylesterase
VLLARNALGHPLRMAAALATLDMKPFARGTRYVRRTYFTAETPDVESLAPRLQGESLLAFSAIGPLGAHPRPVPKRTPVLVIAGERDPNYPPALLEKTARAWGGELAVVARSGHEVMLDAAWREGAEALALWAQRLTGRSASASAA